MTKNQEKRDSFVLYKSFYGPVSGLTDEQLGRLFRAIFRWQIDGVIDQDPDTAVNMAVAFITNQFRIDAEKYRVRCERNQANATIRWEKAKNATACDRMQTDANGCDPMPNDNDNENDNDNDNENDNDKGVQGDIPPTRKRSFVKPSLSEVEAYCNERGNGIDPAMFLDHYEANGWMVGKNKMRDWRAAIRTWERNRGQMPTTGKVNQGTTTSTRKVITDPNDLFKD